MLRFEPVAFQDDADARYGAVIVTSANALRACGDQPAIARLMELPLFAVGERTAEAARDIGFRNVVSADGDATALRDLMAASVRAKTLKKTGTLLYLAGADLARDLAGELGERGFNVVTQTTYRMAPILALPRDVCVAFAANRVEAVLHYSRRSARAFLDAARAGRGRNLGAGHPAMLPVRGHCVDCPGCRGDPGHGGAHARRKSLVRGAGSCAKPRYRGRDGIEFC